MGVYLLFTSPVHPSVAAGNAWACRRAEVRSRDFAQPEMGAICRDFTSHRKTSALLTELRRSRYRRARIARCNWGSRDLDARTTQRRALASRAAARADPHRGARRRWPGDRSEQAVRCLGGHHPARPSPLEAGGPGRPHLRRSDLESSGRRVQLGPEGAAQLPREGCDRPPGAWVHRRSRRGHPRCWNDDRQAGVVPQRAQRPDGDHERGERPPDTLRGRRSRSGGARWWPPPHQPGAARRARDIQPPAAASRHACSWAPRDSRRPGGSRARRWARATSRS